MMTCLWSHPQHGLRYSRATHIHTHEKLYPHQRVGVSTKHQPMCEKASRTDQKTSQQQCRCQLISLCSTARLGRSCGWCTSVNVHAKRIVGTLMGIVCIHSRLIAWAHGHVHTNHWCRRGVLTFAGGCVMACRCVHWAVFPCIGSISPSFGIVGLARGASDWYTNHLM